MTRSFLPATGAALLALALTACSESPTPAKKAAEKKAPAPVTGLTAIAETFRVARQWAPDLALLRVENGDIPEAKSQPGKSGLWRVSYVSPSKNVRREYTFAAADSEGGIIQGVRAGDETPYAASSRVQPFAVQTVRIDTNAALATANEEVEKDKAMKKWLGQNPQSPVMFLLEWPGSTPNPQWRVIYGASISQSEFSALIDANTGKFVKTLR